MAEPIHAKRPIGAPPDIAGGNIVKDRIAGNDIKCVVDRNVAALPANNGGDFDFPIIFLGIILGQVDLLVRRNDHRTGFEEKQRLNIFFFNLVAHFSGVAVVIVASAIDSPRIV